MKKTKLDHNCKLTYFLGLGIGTLLITSTAFQAPPDFLVIDTHEHVESLEQAETLLAADETAGIAKTILLPTPEETLRLNGRQSFTYYKENTDKLLEIAEAYPKKFITFCTIDPRDPNALEYLKECHQKGGKGLKLYNGHSYYYNIFQLPLDAESMMPIYTYAQENHLPVVYHVNITNFENELRSVLDKFPDMVVSVPYYMVSSIHLERVMGLLDDYPNLYTNIGFGDPQFLAAGFRRITRNPGKYANFINDYSDRILFGANMVLSESNQRDQEYIEKNILCYRDLLEQRTFTCEPVTEYYSSVLHGYQTRYDACEPKDEDYCKELKDKTTLYEERLKQVSSLNGLNLSNSVLRDIYETNPADFLDITLIGETDLEMNKANADEPDNSEEIIENIEPETEFIEAETDSEAEAE